MRFELTPEMIAAEKVMEEKRAVAAAAKAELGVAYDHYQSLKDLWWESNLENFNLDNAEDLREVSKHSWNSGMGNPVISRFLDEWVRAQNVHFTKFGHRPATDPYDYDNYIPAIQVNIYEPLTDVEKQELAVALKKMFTLMNSISEISYGMNLYSSMLDEEFQDNDERGTAVLTSDGESLAVEINNYGRFEDIIEGTFEEIVDYITKKR